MTDLHRVPTRELEEELVRRRKGEWRDKPSKPIPNCDECENFQPYTTSEHMPVDYNPCSKGHVMRFRVPHTMGDVNAGNWGFYRRGCPDRSVPA